MHRYDFLDNMSAEERRALVEQRFQEYQERQSLDQTIDGLIDKVETQRALSWQTISAAFGKRS